MMPDLSAEAVIALVGVLLSVPAVIVLFWTLYSKFLSKPQIGVIAIHYILNS